jgi:hypothetical protein
MGPQIQRGLFDYNTLTVSFGHEKSKPENRFIAQAVKVPAFNHTYREREDAGGGCYYNNWETITKEIDNAYVILRDGVAIGWMMPYAPCHNIKSDLRLLEDKHTFKAIKDFAATLKPRAATDTALG